jgi:hypothetical protein
MKTKLLIIALSLCLIGCREEEPKDKPTVVRKVSIGKILDMQPVITAEGNATRVIIRTERAVVMLVWEAPTVELGREAYLIDWSDGQRNFEWQGGNKAYRTH